MERRRTQNMRKSFAVCVAAGVCCFFATGSSAEPHYYSDNTRELFFLPRSASLAGAEYIFSRDCSPQANPAILAFDSVTEVSVSYASYYQNTFSSSILSYAGSIDQVSGFGISLSYLYVPDIMGTQNLQTEADGTPVYDQGRLQNSTYSDVYFCAGYGRSIFKSRKLELSAGIGISAQRQRLPFNQYRGYSMGLDGGMAADFPRTGLRLSLRCDNITTQYTRWSANYSEIAYPHLRLGAGWHVEIPYIYGRIQILYKSLDILGNEGANAVDVSTLLSTDQPGSSNPNQLSGEKPAAAGFNGRSALLAFLGSAGLEYTIKEMFSIRLGGNLENKLAFGCGVNLLQRRLCFDASYAMHELAPTYQIGVTYRR
jgi:hypothetical protein